MNKKLRWFLMGGISLAIFLYLAELIFITTCSDGLGCLAVGIVYEAPGLIINEILKTKNETILTIVDNIFYFILGGVIGLITYKIMRGKQKSKK